tara:strand:- start:102 stop:452 length:351 start_codon:yes stop_codon:yes gene_type:complete
MSIGLWQIGILFLILFGSGYLGIYIFKQNPKFKKYINKKNIVIISLSYIIIVSFISGKNAAFGFGAFLSPFIISIVNSLFRNKMVFKKTFDEKFYYFFLGVLITFGFMSTIGALTS